MRARAQNFDVDGEQSGELRRELEEDLRRFLDEPRALANQPVTTACERTVDRARDREHLASVVPRGLRRDQRAAVPRGFDDECAERKPRDDAVALREAKL